MYYVYRRTRSTGARELATALAGTRIRTLDRIQGVTRQGDILINWGENSGNLPGVRALNAAPVRNKFDDAQALRAAGVPTVQVSRTRPLAAPAARPVAYIPPVQAAPVGPDPALALWENAQEVAGEFDTLEFARGPVAERAVQEILDTFGTLRTALQTARTPQARPVATPIQAPVAATREEWVGRTNDHTGGLDLLTPPARPDFWVRKENLVREYRVHSFNGRSIRAGVKEVREGFRDPANVAHGTGTRVANHWIRSYDGGWRINYDSFESSNAMRTLAASAITALGLTFGAVDIGEKADGTLIVLEVNRAPGLEGGTVTAYANAIRAWDQNPTPARPNRPRAARGAARRT